MHTHVYAGHMTLQDSEDCACEGDSLLDTHIGMYTYIRLAATQVHMIQLDSEICTHERGRGLDAHIQTNMYTYVYAAHMN